MILFNYEITLGHDFVTRVQPRPWFRIERQEHYSGEWEILMGNTLLLITRKETEQELRDHHNRCYSDGN